VSEYGPDGKILKDRKEKATVQEHIDFLKKQLGELKRDVFSGDLCYFEPKAKRWIPVLDDLAMGYVESKAIKAAEEGKSYTLSHFERHVKMLTQEAKKELLISIPTWDGEDRIGLIAKCLECKNLRPEHVESLLKDWFSKMMVRIYDPLKQNRILVMQGNQGLGKDHLVKMCLSHLGQYLVPFLIQQQERDTSQQLISGLVMVISEYDRTNKTEVASLKNMITMDRVSFRGAYAKTLRLHTVRASFIATCNVDGILRDWTGNRRYIIFELNKIHWEYPQGHSAQILAQAHYLAREGYEATEGAESALAEYLGEQTPDNPENTLVDDFVAIFREKFPLDDSKMAKDLEDVWQRLHKIHGLNVNYMRGIIKRKGYGKKETAGIRYYKTKMKEEQKEEDEWGV